MVRAGSFLVWSIILGVAFVFVHSVSLAEPQQAGLARNQAEPVNAEQPAPHQVSIQKSRVYIFVDKSGLGHQHGVEGRLQSGSLTLGFPKDAGELVFDMNSFNADTDTARRYVGLSGSTDASTRRQVTVNMKNTSILNVNQFPTATFAIKSAKLQEKKSQNGTKGQHDSGSRAFCHSANTVWDYTIRKALGAVGVADQLVIHGDLWIATGTAP